MLVGFSVLSNPDLSKNTNVLATLFVQVGGAFFFSITVGWAIEKIRLIKGGSDIWLFSQEFQSSGLLGFYADRGGSAEAELEKEFANFKEGEILLVGASLRLFLGPGLRYYKSLDKIIKEKGPNKRTIKAVFCNPNSNKELPTRAFVEEFNQDGSTPKTGPFDWLSSKTISLNDFNSDFFEKYGLMTAPENRSRVVHDLESSRQGYRALKGYSAPSNSIEGRLTNYAPYCTAVIFPNKVFFTPNLLSEKVPVNLPTLVFHKNSDTYQHLYSYFNFLWWSGENI